MARLVLTGLLFLVLFWTPLGTLVRDWWTNSNAAYGLLLAPIAVYLAWRSGLAPQPRPQRVLGLAVLCAAIALRYLSGLAAELFTMHMSLLFALCGLVIYAWGWRQLVRWWLPVVLLVLSVPIPEVLLNSLSLSLQLKSSEGGAALLALRHVPVRLSGNVIDMPGQRLFVTEACSGLRSLTALLALGVLVGGLWLRRPWTRLLLVLTAVPVAMAFNSVRIFLTGFLVYYVSPALGKGVMHLSEGWVIFVLAFAALAVFAWGLRHLERPKAAPEDSPHADAVDAGPGGLPAPSRVGWLVAGLLAVGVLFTVGISTQRALPLRAGLAAAIPDTVDGYAGAPFQYPAGEVRAAGVSTYLARMYAAPVSNGAVPRFSLYVGYYREQSRGQTIHSPKNCLPGAGWQAVSSATVLVPTVSGRPVRVNKYIVEDGGNRALVLYWYQGRGRVESSEYRVKWDLLRDKALRGRSDEALVRIVVPLIGPDADTASQAVAIGAAARIVPALFQALPS